MALDTREYYLPHTLFRQVGHLTAYEMEIMGEKYPEARSTSSGIPVFGMIHALNAERKKLTDAFGSNLNKPIEEAKLEFELKEENILAKRILNQAKLGILILKDEASERVKKVFRSVMVVIKTGIKNSAARLINITDQPDIEAILTEEWNEAIKDLERASKVISWEQDGSVKLLQTRLADIEKQDPEFVDAIKGRQYETQDK